MQHIYTSSRAQGKQMAALISLTLIFIVMMRCDENAPIMICFISIGQQARQGSIH